MNNRELLIHKLDEFIRKYYKNQLIKGSIYSVGLLLLFFLVFTLLEYAGEFTPGIRTAMFYLYLLSAAGLTGYYIVIPLMHLMKAGKQISYTQAAGIIGNHFGEVRDKLLNVLQLQQEMTGTAGNDLLYAAVDQKISELRPVPFAAAVDFRKNRKYAKYALIPFSVLLILLAAAPGTITSPANRLVHHNLNFEKPSPFEFIVKNRSLKAVRGNDFELLLLMNGKVVPHMVYIETEGQQFIMQKTDKRHFSYLFKSLPGNIVFRFFADGYYSPEYTLEAIANPVVTGFEMHMVYPAYLQRPAETIKNTGDVMVPEGTQVKWVFHTRETSYLQLKLNDSLAKPEQTGENSFTLSRTLFKTVSCELVPQNKEITSTKKMQYLVQVVPDNFPTITLETKKDSISARHLYFNGEIRDDYGFRKLSFVYYKTKEDSTAQKQVVIALPVKTNSPVDHYFYHWDLSSFNLQPGDAYEYYFEISDNDALHGYKSVRTQTQVFKAPAEKELKENRERDNAEMKDKLSAGISKAREIQREMNELNKKLTEKKNLNFDEMKKLKDLVEKQKEFQKTVEELQREQAGDFEKHNEFSKEDEQLLEKQKQLEEIMKNVLTPEMKEKLKELEKMLEKLDKEKAQEALEKMKMDNKDMEKELDRSLEIFKQLEFEKKLEETIKNIDKLADEQEKLAEKTEKEAEKSDELEKKQDELNKKFDEIRKDLDDLHKKNDALQEPNQLGKTETNEQEIKKEMEQSSQELNKKQQKKAAKSQKGAAAGMREMSKKMSEDMEAMEDEGEDAEALRQLLENLLSISFGQEELMNKVKSIDRSSPNYLKLVQQQKKIKDDAKMIEDSLFALSKRQPMIASVVNREIADINSNMQKAIQSLEARQVPEAASRQQYVMTAVNNLALILSESLQQMQMQMQQKKNSKPGSGKCNKPGGSGSKPSMSKMKAMQEQINKQIQKLKEEMAKQKEGKQPGKEQGKQQGKPGQTGQGGMSESLAKLAAQQEALRRELQKAADQLNKDGKEGNGNLRQITENMEKTETDLVNKMITQETLRRQQEILTRLLEAEKAERERELDEKRESREAKNQNFRNPAEFLEYNMLKQKEAELIQTIPPAMHQYYKQKVNEYFSTFEKR